MKRLLALLLSILTLFSLCACDGGKKDTNSKPSEHSVDVAYFASLGKIPELEYALGTDPDEILNPSQDAESHTEESVEDDGGHTHDAPIITKSEGELSVMLNGGTFIYYYEKDKADNGISAIVCLSEAYGFKIGSQTVTEETVKAALSKHNPIVATPTEDDLFFLPDTGTNATALVYTFNGKYKLQFFFIDSAFSAVMLSDIQNWTI